MKTCVRCKLELTETEFSKDKSKPDGLCIYCKSCIKNHREGHKEYFKQYMKKHYEEHKEEYKEQRKKCALKRDFNLTPEQYNEMLLNQNGVCAICGGINKNGRKLAVDHNHVTNAVRGLLCIKCNMGIGCLQDDPSILQASIEYLGQYTEDFPGHLTQQPSYRLFGRSLIESL